MTTLHDELNQIGSGMLLRRVRAAEAVAWQALNITPLKDETAEQLLARIRFSAERNHPELLVRFEHSRQDIYRRAEDCGCDPNADDYDDNHSESDEGGEYLCGRQHLGMVCGTCENEADDGPSWRPDRYEWPCPAVRALDSVEPAEETHVVADDSSNPEHTDDCPGCEPTTPDTLRTQLDASRAYEQRLREQHDHDVAELNRLRARVWELERPAVEKHRGEVQLSMRQLAAQAREDGDYESEAVVLQRLADREAQWAAEDAAARPAATTQDNQP